MALQYLDKEGLERFWKNTKEYIDKTDEKLQSEIDAITGGSSGGGTSLAGLEEALNREISDRETADTALQESLTAETEARVASDADLQENIEAEATARQEADAAINSRIDGISSSNQEALETLEAKVDQEIEDRKAGDAALLGTEEDAKELNTIHGLRAQIEFEASNAEGAVSNLEKKLYGSDAVPEDIEGYTLNDLHDALAKEVSDRTAADETLSEEIAAAKAELIGVESDASTADTVWGAKKRTDKAKAELQGKIDTLNSETIKTITITEDAGDEGPSVVPTTNTVAIHLPNYRLESEADALDITKGALAKIGDDVHEDVTVANNTVTVSLHNYTLQTSHDALSTRTATLETLTAGDWRAQNDEGTETNTIKSYIDLKSARIPDSEITDLMDRING